MPWFSPAFSATAILWSWIDMKVHIVDDPKDTSNPFVQDTDPAGPLLAYHGTSSLFSPDIERNGFAPGKIAYDMNDVQAINRAYEKVGWFGTNAGGYIVLKPFTTGNTGSHIQSKPISFTIHCTRARDYSTNRGGETISNIILAVDEFEDFCNGQDLRRKHISDLQREYDRLHAMFGPSEEQDLLNAEPGVIAEFRRMKGIPDLIAKCEDEAFLAEALKGLKPLREKYGQVAQSHRPVLYAILYDKARFDERSRGDDLRLTKPYLQSEIIGKVSFPNGIDASTTRLPINDVFDEWLAIEERFSNQ